MINVTKTWLPPFEEYAAILKKAWASGWVTNNGSLLLELEKKLKAYLNVDHLLVCSNGTIVLQMALKALDITKEVITTPFSYVATVNAILWEGCKPVFVDIRPDDFCIDAEKIEAAITENTQAILATHVYGFPCDVDAIEKLADKYQLKVIYDGAHAFGCTYKGKSLLDFGDISTCSFHATKIFHTVEGGAVICKESGIYEKLFYYRQFGHYADDYYSIGINAKLSEFHSAMGLCMVDKIELFRECRQKKSKLYDRLFKTNEKLHKPFFEGNFRFNYGYFPVVFDSEVVLLKVKDQLNKNNINPRRYFFPSLNLLPFLKEYQACEISESISSRVLCLPLFADLSDDEIAIICDIINGIVNQ